MLTKLLRVKFLRCCLSERKVVMDEEIWTRVLDLIINKCDSQHRNELKLLMLATMCTKNSFLRLQGSLRALATYNSALVVGTGTVGCGQCSAAFLNISRYLPLIVNRTDTARYYRYFRKLSPVIRVA